MAAGRFVLGMGSEPLIVAITTALAKWFQGARSWPFAIALNLTLGRLGFGGSRRLCPTGPVPRIFTGWQPPLFLAAGIGAGGRGGRRRSTATARAARRERAYGLGRAGHRRPAGVLGHFC